MSSSDIRMIINPRLGIFLTSGLLLFLELALIRYLPANIAYLGYYSNFILLASFVGLGVGMLMAQGRRDLTYLFPWLLLATAGAGSVFAVAVFPDSSGEIHFTSTLSGLIIPEFILIPFIFLGVVATFAALAQRLGRLFVELPPLTAYRWDILGSLSGILLFTLAAYFSLGPTLWFGLVAVVFLFLTFVRERKWYLSAAALACLLIVVALSSSGARWSPYQKLHLKPIAGTNDLLLYANNIGHQRLEPVEELPMVYSAPYELFTHATYRHALVIGAGTGNDVAMALSQGVERVTAVEIDPEILALGRAYHPDRPYHNPRVTTVVDDARTFLRRTTETYDLIIFALPDSVLLASGRGNIRLESFLFTQEAFAAARDRLTSGGLLVLYNYYRQPWLVDKMAGMLQVTFGTQPYVVRYDTAGYMAALMAGPRTGELKDEAPPSLKLGPASAPATDDWPFLYLRIRGLPWVYLFMLGVIGLIIYAAVRWAARGRVRRRLEPTYFFLGVAFMLLETTALTRFALLFGTTWLVNSLVFFAILALVLCAIAITRYLPASSLPWWYGFLGLGLAAQYLVPLQQLLALPDALKYVAVSLLTLVPVFFANIIFSLTFKSSQENDTNFASNVLGAGVGGIVEYAALMTGYHQLTVVVALCYAIAFLLPWWRQRSAAAVTDVIP